MTWTSHAGAQVASSLTCLVSGPRWLRIDTRWRPAQGSPAWGFGGMPSYTVAQDSKDQCPSQPGKAAWPLWPNLGNHSRSLLPHCSDGSNHKPAQTQGEGRRHGLYLSMGETSKNLGQCYKAITVGYQKSSDKTVMTEENFPEWRHDFKLKEDPRCHGGEKREEIQTWTHPDDVSDQQRELFLKTSRGKKKKFIQKQQESEDGWQHKHYKSKWNLFSGGEFRMITSTNHQSF